MVEMKRGLLVLGIWIFVAVLTPVLLAKCFSLSSEHTYGGRSNFFRKGAAVMIYLATTGLWGFFMLLLVIGPEPRRSDLSIGEVIGGLVAIGIFGALNWLSGSLVARKLVNPFSVSFWTGSESAGLNLQD